ncbi:hypothetical protein [Roseomonas sp. 18066]|uniref:hypothetical protein n=1 Tax=Roseomonas sp. 18066 TaxID=2681412 RepID=UPI00135C78E3|nr:hypothetical protein [Roseomonas sp. 18066]
MTETALASLPTPPEALTRDLDWLTALPPALERGDPEQPRLPPDGALGIFLGARVLLRGGRGAEAWDWIEAAIEAYARAHPAGHRHYVWSSALGDALGAYNNLRLVVVEALIAAQRWPEAAQAMADLSTAALRHDSPSHLDPALLRDHPLGPLWHDAAWQAAQLRQLCAPGRLDPRKSTTWSLRADFLIVALKTGATGEARAFVERHAEEAWPVEDRSHYGFNALCVLASTAPAEQAVAAARELIRRGYDLLWRFNREAVEQMPWTRATGQLDWLAPLEDAPGFAALRAAQLGPVPPAGKTPHPGPFKSVWQDTLGGKTRKRCALSRRLIAPGEPVIRFRLFHEHLQDTPAIAALEAFEASDLAPWRDRHRADGYAAADFARPRHRGARAALDAPAAAAFLFDLGEGGGFDVDAFLACITEAPVNPMRFHWLQGRAQRLAEPPDGFCCNDAHAGDYVTLTWMMLRSGHQETILDRLRGWPAERADPVMAMLSTFDRPALRAAAAAHFGIADLPEVLSLIFQSRQGLEDVLRISAFGRDQPRFAAAMAAAMARWNLHLYSNSHPQVDWFLQDLEHYTVAHGTRLTWLFIEAPARLPVLARMLQTGWLPTGVGSGGYDGYSNTSHALHRAAVMNRALLAPDGVAYWLETEWITRLLHAPALREAQRQVAALAKRRE